VKFPRNIKWRMPTIFLVMLSVILIVFSIFSYILLAQSAANNEMVPATVFTTQIAIPQGTSVNTTTPGSQNYEKLFFYTISADTVKSIQDGNARALTIPTVTGNLSINQSIFITAQAQGGQKIWIYYRISPEDNSEYELLIMVHSSAADKLILGNFTNVLIYALPVILVLAFVLGFFIVKRMLKPIDQIRNNMRETGRGNPYQPIEVPAGSEFSELTTSLNRAFGRMQQTVDSERQMVTDASHEIRAPLTVMMGETSLALRKKRTVEEYEKCLRTVSSESAYLATMVNKLLLAAQLDNAKSLTNAEDLNLSGFLAGLSPAFTVLCKQRSMTFHFNAEPGIMVRGDTLKLRELFFNLIDNAAKYNRPGGNVTLSLKREENFARVDVTDTGIGIKPENLGHIFERFYRVDKKDERGAGLGLALCKKITEIHGGKIDVSSEYGKSSTFSVWLPVVN
jgi:signal transduction histidine kinase